MTSRIRFLVAVMLSAFFLWVGGCQSPDESYETDVPADEVEAVPPGDEDTDGSETGTEAEDEPDSVEPTDPDDGDSDEDTGFEIPEVDYVTEEQLREYLEALSAIATANRGNRAAGTSGYAASVDYVKEYLEGLGLEVRLQPFSVDVYEVGDEQVLTLESVPGQGEEATPEGADIEGLEFVYGEDYGIIDYCGSGDITAPVHPVDVDMPPSAQGGSTSGCESADFVNFPAGAIALIQRGTCLFQTKVRKAKQAGATAVIIFNEGQEGRTELFGGAMEGGPDVAIPVLATSFAVGQQLYDFAQAGETLVRVSTDIYEGPQVIHNVLATYPGRSGKRWVVGGHLDSVAAGPGINDNGSGVAMLLSAAQYLAQTQPDLEHGIELAFWGAEEIGLIGSLHYVRELPEDEISSILGNLNFDMIGSPNPGRFVYDGDQSMYQTGIVPPVGSDVIEQVFNQYFDNRDIPYAPTAFDGRSDYYGFVQVGIPAGGLFTGAEEAISYRESELFDVEEGDIFDACYHQYCDDFGNVDFEMLTQLSQTAIHATLTLVAHPFFAEQGQTESASDATSAAQQPSELPAHVDHACHGVRHLVR